jgi:WD40 repeat protein
MSEPTPSAASPSVPGYELLRCIGRGSYGEVWLARDGSGGFRAVKVVYRKTFEHDRPFERELSGIQKFEPVSRSHPSQVSILQVGRNIAEGYFYYVMELADDAAEERRQVEKWESEKLGTGSGTGFPPAQTPTLLPANYSPRTLKSELTRRGRLSFRECLDISLALATALEHLHQHGLIHRDIKPSNVIFVQGVPKLADIGLVTDAGASISFVGTEGFLPPEGPGTPQADLYSLGKVLYEISTGRDRMDFPELPTFVDEAAEKEHLLELNQIFLKACQNDPRRRYQSAREMSADLALLHSGKSLRRAREVGRRLAQARLLASAAVLFVLAIALANHFIQQRRVNEAQREQARQENAAAIYRGAAIDKSHRLADTYIANGQMLEAEGDFSGALLWFSQALDEDRGDSARAEACRQRIASLWQRTPIMPELLAHSGGINSTAYSGDGRCMITASDDKTAQVWDAATAEPVGRPLTHSSRVLHAELSSDGERALTLTDDGVVQLWSQLANDPVATRLDHEGRFVLAVFSPNGRQFITVTDGAGALLWETSSRRVRFTLKQREQILCAAFSADGRTVATGGVDQTAQVWDTETGQPITPPLANENTVTRLAFSPDGRRLATVGGARARVWSARSGDPALFVLRHDAAITSLAFSPDGKQLLSASDDTTARVWDALTGELVGPPLRHAAAVRQAEYSPDGRFIVTTSGDRVQLWSARAFEMIPPTFIHNAAVREVRFSPAGRRLLTASADGTARVFQLDARPRILPDSEQERRSPTGHPKTPFTDGDWMAWAQLRSGRQISSNEQIAPVPAEALQKLWAELRMKFPGGVESSDVSAWHAQAAEACEKTRDWFGAGFHWKQAQALQPGEERFRAGCERTVREQARSEMAAARGEELPRRIPARSADARALLLDLSAHYNAALTETWLPTNVVASGNDLSALPRGVQKFGGVEFDVRGVIQLSGGALENSGGKFPREIGGIQVGRLCRKIHFLHGAGWSARAGTHIGSYMVHYADGESREVKILFGQNVREWLAPPAPQLITGAAVAWEGSSQASRALGLSVRLYQMTWLNPRPGAEVQRIDFKSAMENSAPFLIAITVESPSG